jgi:hypothetical protein
MRVYLSGPMTGYPDFNYAAFAHAGGLLLDAGYTVLDPARHGFVDGWTWADYMRAALRDIAEAEGVVVITGWQCSRGAVLEVHIAQQLGLPVLPLDVALANPPRKAAA